MKLNRGSVMITGGASGLGLATAERLRADGDGPTAYLFHCLHCDWYGAFMAAG